MIFEELESQVRYYCRRTKVFTKAMARGFGTGGARVHRCYVCLRIS